MLLYHIVLVSAVQQSESVISSVAQLCPTLCDPMNHSMPGLPVQNQLLEFTQTCIHRVSDAIQPSHPLSSPSPPALKSFPASRSFQMSQLFASGSQSIGVSASTSVLLEHSLPAKTKFNSLQRNITEPRVSTKDQPDV